MKAGIAAIMVSITETIREAGKDGAPSGVLYAALMGVGVNLEIYNLMIEKLVGTGLIRKSGNVLYWSGPEIPGK